MACKGGLIGILKCPDTASRDRRLAIKNIGTGIIGIATAASLIAFRFDKESIMVVRRNKARNEVVRQFGAEEYMRIRRIL
jgi:threonine dehydrogenase-like Zn-dependent dehydrogenase